MPASVLFASVIPDRKTPRAVNAFTYAIPAELKHVIAIGTTVTIPFRNRLITGVVLSIEEAATVQKGLKFIESICIQQLWLRSDRMSFLQWFAMYYCISLPTALHTLQRPLTKKAEISLEKMVFLDKKPPEIILYNTPRSQKEALLSALKIARGPFIIVAPELQHVQQIEKNLREAQVEYLTIFGSTSKKIWTQAQSIALGKTKLPQVIIGSRTILFLAFGPHTTIYIDNEHEKLHKQYEMNPRYRAGVIAQFLAHQAQGGIERLLLASPSPTLYSWMQFRDNHATLHDMRQKTPIDPVLIDMNHYANEVRWLSDQAMQKIRTSKKVFLFLNRIGLTASIICLDCGKTNSEKIVQCQFCRSTKLKTVKKGIQQLEAEIQQTFPGKRVLRIDSTTDNDALMLEEQITGADIIVGTEKVLRTSTLSQVDVIVVLSVDHLLIYPHYQSQERVFQLLTALHYAQKPLIIQTHSIHHPLWAFVRIMDPVGFLDAELRMRKMLKRPPISPLWVARNPKNKEMLRFTEIQELQKLPVNWLVDVIDD